MTFSCSNTWDNVRWYSKEHLWSVHLSPSLHCAVLLIAGKLGSSRKPEDKPVCFVGLTTSVLTFFPIVERENKIPNSVLWLPHAYYGMHRLVLTHMSCIHTENNNNDFIEIKSVISTVIPGHWMWPLQPAARLYIVCVHQKDDSMRRLVWATQCKTYQVFISETFLINIFRPQLTSENLQNEATQVNCKKQNFCTFS